MFQKIALAMNRGIQSNKIFVKKKFKFFNLNILICYVL